MSAEPTTVAPMEDVKSTDPGPVASAATAPDTSKQNVCLRALQAALKSQKNRIKHEREELKTVRTRVLATVNRHSRVHDTLHELLTKAFPSKPRNALQLFIDDATKEAASQSAEFKSDAGFIKSCHAKWKVLSEDVKRSNYQARYMAALENYVTTLARVDVQAVLAGIQQLALSDEFKDDLTPVLAKITDLLNEVKKPKKRTKAVADAAAGSADATVDDKPPAAKKKKTKKTAAAAATPAAVVAAVGDGAL